MRELYFRDLLMPHDPVPSLRYCSLQNECELASYYRFGYEPLPDGLTPQEFERLQVLWIGFELTETRSPLVESALQAQRVGAR